MSDDQQNTDTLNVDLPDVDASIDPNNNIGARDSRAVGLGFKLGMEGAIQSIKDARDRGVHSGVVVSAASKRDIVEGREKIVDIVDDFESNPDTAKHMNKDDLAKVSSLLTSAVTKYDKAENEILHKDEQYKKGKNITKASQVLGVIGSLVSGAPVLAAMSGLEAAATAAVHPAIPVVLGVIAAAATLIGHDIDVKSTEGHAKADDHIIDGNADVSRVERLIERREREAAHQLGPQMPRT